MSQLICKNLALGYEGTTVLSDLSFSVEAGDYLCVVGENGTGKSTLIKGLLHLKAPLQGTVEAGDGLLFREIGYLPQQSSVQRDFPAGVWEVVLSGRLNALNGRLFYRKQDREAAEKALETFEISHLRNCSYRTLSGGQQQRVLLARALCAAKKLLLLDEPVTGLDPVAAAELYALLKRINRENGITIIMVSHDLSALQYATKILHLGQTDKFFGTLEAYRASEMGRHFLPGGTFDAD